jgi:hypothetical protein
VDLSDVQRVAQGADQLAAQLGDGSRLRRGGGDAVQRGLGTFSARS